MKLLCKWGWRIWWKLGRICCFLRRKRVNRCTRNMCQLKEKPFRPRKIKSKINKNTRILRNNSRSFNPKMDLDCILSFRKCWKTNSASMRIKTHFMRSSSMNNLVKTIKAKRSMKQRSLRWNKWTLRDKSNKIKWNMSSVKWSKFSIKKEKTWKSYWKYLVYLISVS